jgi:DNA-binding CsgD family transcriptional regulator
MVGPLLHRETEFGAIDAALAQVRAGSPAVLVFLGERGIGKSSLLTCALTRAPSPAVVLRAQCHDSEREFPFGVVRQLFDPLVTAGQSVADPAVPQLRADMGGAFAGEPDTVPPHDLLYNMFRATRSLAATRPLVIAIDDITKADRQSVRWCGYIARRLEGLPVALILTGDPDADGAEELVADLGTLSYAHLLRPGPLCPDCVTRGLRATWGVPVPAAVADTCHTLTRGNPLVLRELLARLAAAPREGGPALDEVVATGAATLAETTLQWLSARDPGVAQLLEHFAILGPAAGLETAAVLAGRGELEAAESRRALRRMGILADSAPDRFSHEAFRTASLARIAPRARQELHLRAASLLHRLGERADQAAEHLMSVGPAGCAWALDVLTRAALDAAAAGEWERASRYLRRALAEPAAEPSPRLVAALAAAELHRDLPACVRHLRTVLGLPGVRERAHAVRPLAHALLSVDTVEVAQLFADTARRLAAGDRDADDRGPLLTLAAQGLLGGHRGAARTAVRLVDKGGSDAASREFMAAWALAMAAGGRSRERALRLVERCVGGAQLLDTEAAGWADVGVAIALGWTDRLDEAGYWARAAVTQAAGRNSASEHAFALVALADIAYRRGELGPAYAAAERAGELARACGGAGLHAAAGAVAARVLLERGEPELARAALDGADPKAVPHPLVRAGQLEARGLLAVALGQPRDGLRLFLDCGYQLAARGIANPACVPWRAAAIHAHVALGELAAARAMAREELAYAQSWGGPITRARALAAAAAAYPGERGLALLREAVELLGGTGALLEQAWAQVRLGVAWHERGNEVAAREALGGGLELATRAGATRLAGIARDRLVAAGARRRGEPAGQRVALTPSERRVIDLVLRGMTSGEVAQSLLISKRTVDTHLARVYRKLGIRSRTRLAAALAASGTEQ